LLVVFGAHQSILQYLSHLMTQLNGRTFYPRPEFCTDH
jgi:hypothetical protein